MQTATAATPTNANSIIQEIGRPAPVKQPENGLNPKLPRYGFTPIHTITGLPTTAFGRESLPGSRFLVFRTFQFPITNSNDMQELRDKNAAEQAIDLLAVAGDKFATEFPMLAHLDENKALEVLSLLINPNNCTKYPFDLQNTCSTCWLDYLRNESPMKIVEAFENDAFTLDAATETLRLLINSLEQGIDLARGRVDEALRAVDDPKDGKDRFYDADWLNIYHTHQDRPQMKTSTNGNDATTHLANTIAQAIGQNQAPAAGLTLEQVRAMIDDATKPLIEENAWLKAQIEASNEPKPDAPLPTDANIKKETKNGR